MTVLVTTIAHAGDLVAVVGMDPVRNPAAQMFHIR